MRYLKTFHICLIISTAFFLNVSSYQAGAIEEDSIENVLERVKLYDYGGSTSALRGLEKIVRESFGKKEERRRLEKKMIEVLQSPSATDAAKRFVCTQLWIVGSAQSVPVLEKMLAGDKTAELACYALSENPSPQAGEALRAALKTARGDTRRAVVQLLGHRKDAAAVGPLGKLLRDPDRATARAAAQALGRIGGARAANVLAEARTKGNYSVREPATRAYLQCAESLAAAGRKSRAMEIYVELLEDDSELIRRSAALGVVRTGGAASLDYLVSLIQGDDATLQAMAIANSGLVPGRPATKRLIAEMAKLEPRPKALTIDALAKRGDPLARAAVEKAARDRDAQVRTAALKALGSLGNAASVKVLAKAVAADRAEEKHAALTSLRRLHGKGVEAAMVKTLSGAEPAARPGLIRVLADRKIAAATPALMKLAEKSGEETRKAALKALGALAGGKDLAGMVAILVRLDGDAVRKEAENAVIAAARNGEADRSAKLVATRLGRKGNSEAARNSLVRVLGGIANERALGAVTKCLADNNPTVRDTALRELAEWPGHAAMGPLRQVIQNTENETHRVLAFRGYMRLMPQSTHGSVNRTLDLLREVAGLARLTEEKKLVLSGIANAADPRAADLVEPLLDDESVRAEANAALDKIFAGIKPVSLFNGKTLKGWEGDRNIFYVEDGAIVAGWLDKEVPKSQYLWSEREFEDFELRVVTKLVGHNGGVQFRWKRIPGSDKLLGYQADMGDLGETNLWGCLYDSNRGKLSVISDQEAVAKVVKVKGWNEVVVRCVGGHIQVWVNGLQTVAFTETDRSFSRVGTIAFQVHKGPAAKVWYKDITIKELVK